MAGFGQLVDRAVEPFAPSWAARRMAARAGIEQMRSYAAASEGRRTKGWDRPGTDADAENAGAVSKLRNSGHALFRDNKYANAAVRHMVADLIGDGIAPQFSHADPKVAKAAQDDWDRWAEGRVDGRDDFYAHEKTAAQGMIVGGETLTLWKPDRDGPDARIIGMEGDWLDQSKTEHNADGSKIIQGVGFDRWGDRDAYWIFDAHPGSHNLLATLRSTGVKADHVDHLYDRQRFGQTRGVSWLASCALDLKDIGDIEDAVRQQQKVQACLGLIISPGEVGRHSSLSTDGVVSSDRKSGRQRETVSPGMIYRAEQGDQVTTLNPTKTGGAVDFIRQQLAACSATLAPYHRMTGDVSQANYSSLRAAMLGMWALLDDWQQNLIIPHCVAPAVRRRMRRLEIVTGDRRYRELAISYALPVRRFVDPIKDLMAEVIEIRAGIKTLAKSLAERGINADEHLNKIKQVNDIIDKLGLALDSDPRRLTDSGVLQSATGYLAPKAARAIDRAMAAQIEEDTRIAAALD